VRGPNNGKVFIGVISTPSMRTAIVNLIRQNSPPNTHIAAKKYDVSRSNASACQPFKNGAVDRDALRACRAPRSRGESRRRSCPSGHDRRNLDPDGRRTHRPVRSRYV